MPKVTQPAAGKARIQCRSNCPKPDPAFIPIVLSPHRLVSVCTWPTPSLQSPRGTMTPWKHFSLCRSDSDLRKPQKLLVCKRLSHDIISGLLLDSPVRLPSSHRAPRPTPYIPTRLLLLRGPLSPAPLLLYVHMVHKGEGTVSCEWP